MISQQIQISLSEAALLSSDGSLYPSISGGSLLRRHRRKDRRDRLERLDQHLQGPHLQHRGVAESLRNGGRSGNQTRISKISLLIQQKSTAEAYRSFVLQLRDAYLSLIMQKIALRNAAYNLKLVEGQLDWRRTGSRAA